MIGERIQIVNKVLEGKTNVMRAQDHYLRMQTKELRNILVK